MYVNREKASPPARIPHLLGVGVLPAALELFESDLGQDGNPARPIH